MNPNRHEPLLCSALALLIMFSCSVYIQKIYNSIRAENYATLPPDPEDTTPNLNSMRLQLETWPNRSLFFGLFAYFAVRLFNRPDLPEAGAYLWCLGLCFTLSLTAKTTSVLLKIRLDKVPPGSLEIFASRLKPLLRRPS